MKTSFLFMLILIAMLQVGCGKKDNDVAPTSTNKIVSEQQLEKPQEQTQSISDKSTDAVNEIISKRQRHQAIIKEQEEMINSIIKSRSTLE